MVQWDVIAISNRITAPFAVVWASDGGDDDDDDDEDGGGQKTATTIAAGCIFGFVHYRVYAKKTGVCIRPSDSVRLSLRLSFRLST